MYPYYHVPFLPIHTPTRPFVLFIYNKVCLFAHASTKIILLFTCSLQPTHSPARISVSSTTHLFPPPPLSLSFSFLSPCVCCLSFSANEKANSQKNMWTQLLQHAARKSFQILARTPIKEKKTQGKKHRSRRK